MKSPFSFPSEPKNLRRRKPTQMPGNKTKREIRVHESEQDEPRVVECPRNSNALWSPRILRAFAPGVWFFSPITSRSRSELRSGPVIYIGNKGPCKRDLSLAAQALSPESISACETPSAKKIAAREIAVPGKGGRAQLSRAHTRAIDAPRERAAKIARWELGPVFHLARSASAMTQRRRRSIEISRSRHLGNNLRPAIEWRYFLNCRRAQPFSTLVNVRNRGC